nr:unnamed protein product [Callosobruchus analis]
MAQIQLQMYFAGKKKGMFCLAHEDFESTKKIDVYRVDLDEKYCEDLIEKATNFWKNNIFEKLCNKLLCSACRDLTALEGKCLQLKSKRKLRYYCEASEEGLSKVPILIKEVAEVRECINSIINKHSTTNAGSSTNIDKTSRNLGKILPNRARPMMILKTPDEAKLALICRNLIKTPGIKIYGDLTKAQREYFRKIKAELDRIVADGDNSKAIRFINVPTIVISSSDSKRKAAAERKRKERQKIRQDPEKYALMKEKEKECSRFDFSCFVVAMAHIANDELLISLVEQCAPLYDKASKAYKDEGLKENAWKTIAEHLKIEPAIAKQRWVNLRDRFVRAYREYTSKLPSGRMSQNCCIPLPK